MSSVAPVRRDDLPALYRAASAAAKHGQRSYVVLTGALLVLSVVAAICGALTIKHGSFDIAGLAALIALAGSAFVAFWLLENNPHKRWYDSRAAAETAKSLAWLYMAGGGDFAVGNRSESQVRQDLVERIVVLRRALEEAPLPIPDSHEITSAMRQVRAASLSRRREIYLNGRILDQEGYYSQQGRLNDRLRRRWGLTMIGLQLAGVVAAFLKMLGKIDIDLAGIAVTLAVSVAAWTRTRMHDELAEAYKITAHDVVDLRAVLPEVRTERQWAEFVANAETAFSREHTMWLARRRSL
jgi:SMODS and SLOG-associating 2TM effector domain 3/SMODS and SLOG-associating 2TM effector domain 1